jgi:hypothetical protein
MQSSGHHGYSFRRFELPGTRCEAVALVWRPDRAVAQLLIRIWSVTMYTMYTAWAACARTSGGQLN